MSVSKKLREENNARRRKARGSDGIADWEAVDATLLRRAIASVARQGGALRLGYTRSGSAYAVGVLGDGDPYTDYLRPSDDVDAYLEETIEAWDGTTP